MNTDELRTAFINGLPVIHSSPCEADERYKDIEYKKIRKVIYGHNYEYHNICVSLVMEDENGNCAVGNVKNVRLKDDISKQEFARDCDIELPEKIKELFISRSPVTVTEEPRRDYKEINQIELEIVGGVIKTTCIFSSKYTKREVLPQYIVRDFVEHSGYWYYDALDFRDYLRNKKKEGTQ